MNLLDPIYSLIFIIIFIQSLCGSLYLFAPGFPTPLQIDLQKNNINSCFFQYKIKIKFKNKNLKKLHHLQSLKYFI